MGGPAGGGGGGVSTGYRLRNANGRRVAVNKTVVEDKFGDQHMHMISLTSRTGFIGHVSGFTKGDTLVIKRISVSREFHSQGVGSKLYSEMLTKARGSGMKYFGSDTHVSPDAQRRWAAISKQHPGKVETRPHTTTDWGQKVSKDSGPVYRLKLD